MRCRSGEVLATHARNDRFFCITGDWYFSTRENLQVGHFISKDAAEMELTLFKRHVNEGGIYPESYTMNGSSFGKSSVSSTV